MVRALSEGLQIPVPIGTFSGVSGGCPFSLPRLGQLEKRSWMEPVRWPGDCSAEIMVGGSLIHGPKLYICCATCGLSSKRLPPFRRGRRKRACARLQAQEGGAINEPMGFSISTPCISNATVRRRRRRRNTGDSHCFSRWRTRRLRCTLALRCTRPPRCSH